MSFTGSTAVCKQLASLAGLHMKSIIMELGGHASAIVFGDADLERATTDLAAANFGTRAKFAYCQRGSESKRRPTIGSSIVSFNLAKE